MKILAFTGAGISKASGVPTFDEVLNIRDRLSRDYARANPKAFRQLMDEFQQSFLNAEPNDAHYALAEYEIPIITMNIDGLHQKAGSKEVLEIHGTMPDIVLYGDPAPRYEIAQRLVKLLPYKQAVFLIVGTSFYTSISVELQRLAQQRAARIVTINDNAETKVRNAIKALSQQ